MVNFFTTLFGLLRGLISLIITLLTLGLFTIWLQTRDLFILLANLFSPSRRVGSVVALGNPGHGSTWPKYIPPVKGIDSRSPCPGLNTLANHEILPHDGRNLTYKQISRAIQHAYNLSPTLAEQLTSSAVLLDQGRGHINLHDLNALNIVQHDASFTRPDIAFCPDQSFPHPQMVEMLLDHATNNEFLSINDLVYYSGLRRAKSKRSNGQYSLTWSFLHKYLGSGSCALIYSIFGGDVEDLRIWLNEERFPDGWEPRNREAHGLTIAQASAITLTIEFNINEKQKLHPTDAAYLESDEQ
ncbi:hypothetical protein N7486_005935 [Penicillium sp. IBT 16267x]|nr:hypothetical protein N7486_005935 [Penicillium sp. IBT 16267x]